MKSTSPSAVQKYSSARFSEVRYTSGSPIALERAEVAESIGLIPKAPCVRSNPIPCSSELSTKMGMISPKPSVTIAR